MTELIALSAFIGDRSYRIKIQAGDEEAVRRTLKSINDRIIEFKTRYAGKDMQDYIAMVLAWYATEEHAEVSEALDKENLADQLDNIERILDNQLK